MGIIFASGDIFATPGLQAFAHGCNCAGAMGKGIAIEFKKRWPKMYEEYRRRCHGGVFALGDVFVWEEDGIIIFNLATQQSWRSKAIISAVHQSMHQMVEDADNRGVKAIALPRIASGLGGLPWPSVKDVMRSATEGSRVHLWVCENYMPGVALHSSL